MLEFVCTWFVSRRNVTGLLVYMGQVPGLFVLLQGHKPGLFVYKGHASGLLVYRGHTRFVCLFTWGTDQGSLLV